ncbi:MAG TPA: sulfatase-like hydrolase/transferase, partial [Isosphaeraceae bacterium]
KLDDQDRFFAPRDHWEDDHRLPPITPGDGYYATTAIADHALRCLREHATRFPDRPFFQYLAFTSPHFPLQAPDGDIVRYRGRYADGWDVIRARRGLRLRDLGIVASDLPSRDPAIVPRWNLPEAELTRRIGPGEVGRAVAWEGLTAEQRAFQAEKMAIHAAMIDRMDREIGRVLERLRAMGVLDDTLIVFASDNGASAEQIIRGDGHDPAAPAGSPRSFLGLGPGWSSAANTPFRLHKSYVHEGGIATPLIVSWPAGIRARGELRTDPVHLIDLVPTLRELAGVQPEEPGDGVDPPPLPGRSLVPAFARDGVIARDFLFFNHDGHHALRVGDWKLVTMAETDHAPELYDLATDRGERVNRAAMQPARVAAMAAQWAELEAAYRRQAGPGPRD